MKKEISTIEQKRKVFVGLDVHLASYAVSVVEEGRVVVNGQCPLSLAA